MRSQSDFDRGGRGRDCGRGCTAMQASEFKASSSAASFEFGAPLQFEFEIKSFKLHLILIHINTYIHINTVRDNCQSHTNDVIGW